MSNDYKSKLEEKGMKVYQYIVDNYDKCEEEMPSLINSLIDVDITGQFLSSSARFLAAVDRNKYEKWLTPLIEAAIDKDREHKYIGSLLVSIWGENYMDNIDQLKENDDNFRRIYKRLYPSANHL